MPKGSRHAPTKNAPTGKGRKSRGKHRAVRHPAPLAAKQVSPSRGTPSVPTPSAARIQQVTPQHPYVFGDLKKIGIIAAAMIILLIVLSLVL